MIKPVKINSKGSKSLFIQWDNETETNIPLDMLRRLCPFVTCMTKKEGDDKNYIRIFYHYTITIKSMRPTGSYAIPVTWEDIHNIGIYEYS